MAGSGELGHVEPDLGDDRVRADATDPGHFVEALEDGKPTLAAELPGLRVRWRPCSRDLRDGLVDSLRQVVDVCTEGVQ